MAIVCWEIVEYGTPSDIFNGGTIPIRKRCLDHSQPYGGDQRSIHRGNSPIRRTCRSGCKFSPRYEVHGAVQSGQHRPYMRKNGHLIRCHLYRDNKGGQEEEDLLLIKHLKIFWNAPPVCFCRSG